MNVDRAVFLALTASLAIGCSAAGADDAATTDEAAISAGGGQLCYSADESSSHVASMLGFDPARNFPAAEGFCFEFAKTGANDANGFPAFDEGVYSKCNAYALVFVPHVAANAYFEIEQAARSGKFGSKWDILYGVDRKILEEDFFCQTPIDRVLCQGAPDNGCLRVSTQMVPEAKERLGECMAKWGKSQWDVYTCLEGGTLRPDGRE